MSDPNDLLVEYRDRQIKRTIDHFLASSPRAFIPLIVEKNPFEVCDEPQLFIASCLWKDDMSWIQDIVKEFRSRKNSRRMNSPVFHIEQGKTDNILFKITLQNPVNCYNSVDPNSSAIVISDEIPRKDMPRLLETAKEYVEAFELSPMHIIRIYPHGYPDPMSYEFRIFSPPTSIFLDMKIKRKSSHFKRSNEKEKK